MPLLIDGYNLLYAAGITSPRPGHASFENSRRALLDFLLRVVPQAELPRTTVVFDAAEAPPGLPSEYTYGDLLVIFARDYDSADAMIEELIQRHTAPRRLTVVSSDHRIQRAARRRRAIAIDSDIWYHDILRRHNIKADQALASASEKPPTPLPPGEVEHWMREFGGKPPKALPKPPTADPSHQEKRGIPEAPDEIFPPEFFEGFE